MPAQRKDRAVVKAGDFELAIGFAGMVGGHQKLAAVFDPIDRTAGQPRRERDQEILGIEFAALAEPAADIVFDHLDPVFGEAELPGQNAAIEKRDFGRTR
jgi:hypothetical protein